jgi:hypothetical protein
MREALGNSGGDLMKGRAVTGLLVAGFLALSFDVSAAQYLYFSPNAWTCSCDGVGCWRAIDTYRIILRAPDVSDAVGVSFRIESEAYGPEDFVKVDPADGVMIESGDLFSGVRLSFPAGRFDADTLLTIHVELNAPHSPGATEVASTKDVQLHRSTGETSSLEDVVFYVSHCHDSGTWIEWMHPDTLTAEIGEATTIAIAGIGESLGGYSGTTLDIQDELGWVTDCSPCYFSVDCGPCPWNSQIVQISLAIPSGTSEGTIDELHVVPTGPCCLSSPTTLYVRAIAAVPVRSSSWGRVKAIFRSEKGLPN